jgi:hypothetical protein
LVELATLDERTMVSALEQRYANNDVRQTHPRCVTLSLANLGCIGDFASHPNAPHTHTHIHTHTHARARRRHAHVHTHGRRCRYTHMSGISSSRSTHTRQCRRCITRRQHQLTRWSSQSTDHRISLLLPKR